ERPHRGRSFSCVCALPSGGGGKEILVGLILTQPKVRPNLVPERNQLRVVIEKVQLLGPHGLVCKGVPGPEDKKGKSLADVLGGVRRGIGGDKVVIVPQEEVVGIGTGQAIVDIAGPVGLVKVVDVGALMGDQSPLIVGVGGLGGG